MTKNTIETIQQDRVKSREQTICNRLNDVNYQQVSMLIHYIFFNLVMADQSYMSSSGLIDVNYVHVVI